MGITEESDALAVVVSEERGTISVAIGGKITTSLEEVRLKRVLVSALAK
jgi:DNA integrity scanning protein DisA with diadenylate cyclase activity